MLAVTVDPVSERDRYRAKTPPPHVRAQTVSDAVPREVDAERSSATDDPIEKIAIRQRRTSKQIDNLVARVTATEAQQGALLGMVGTLVTASDVERKTRDARAEAARLDLVAAEERQAKTEAEQRAADREARSANRKLLASIVVPTVAAVLSGIAAILLATRGVPPAVTAPVPMERP